MGIPPGTHQLPARPASRGRHGRGFPPDELDLALAVFLLKILMPRFFVRDPSMGTTNRHDLAGSES
jgi:hypothetical protein